MKKHLPKLSLCVFALSVSFAGWAGNPCMPIAQACMKEGYYKGGDKVGKGLVQDCVMPVVSKQKTLENKTFSDEVLQQCNTTLEKKMQKQSQ